MTNPIDNNAMSPLLGGKSHKRENASTPDERPSGSSAVKAGGTSGDNVKISSAGNQLNSAPRIFVDDSEQASQLAQSVKTALSDNGDLAMAAQGGQIKSYLQALL